MLGHGWVPGNEWKLWVLGQVLAQEENIYDNDGYELHTHLRDGTKSHNCTHICMIGQMYNWTEMHNWTQMHNCTQMHNWTQIHKCTIVHKCTIENTVMNMMMQFLTQNQNL